MVKRLYSSIGTINEAPRRMLVGINSERLSPPKVIFDPILEMFKPNPIWHSRAPILT